MSTLPEITFERQADGSYRAATGPTFDRSYRFGVTEFEALVWRDAPDWRYRVLTFGRVQDEGTAAILEDAKGRVRVVFRTVERAARGER